MNTYRAAALALATTTAALSLAACSAGITTASSATPKQTAPAASAQTRTVNVGGSIGAFPIPSGATVVENIKENKQIEIIIGSVSPQTASSFYTSALPHAGYQISMNELGSTGSNSSALGIEFAGHGYKGTISAASNVSGVSLGSSGSKDVLAIVFTR